METVLCVCLLYTGNWVPLDEYYYGTVEGDSGYTEEKGEFRFKVIIITLYVENTFSQMPVFLTVLWTSTTTASLIV